MNFFILFLISRILTAISTPICPDNCNCGQSYEIWLANCIKSLEEDDISLTWNNYDQIIISCNNQPVNLGEFLTSFGLEERIHGITLQDCPLPSKPFRKIFKNVNITEIHFTAPIDRPLGSVSADLFNGLDLRKLGLGRNGLLDVPVDLISNLSQLTYIDLSSNNLDAIPNGFFKSSPLLTIIKMASNHLRVLNEPLGYLPHLKTLYLHNNQLVIISRAAFKGLTNLEFLDLQGNHLEQLDADVFSDLSNLLELRLFSNRLNQLPDGLLSNNHLVNLLDLHDNPVLELPRNLVTNNSYFYLRKLNIMGCNLSSLPPLFFQNLANLTHLDLSSNHLRNLDENIFKYIPEIVSLTLSYNRLVQLPQKMFVKQRKLQSLDISHNRLINIHNTTFQHAKSLLILDISYNRLNQLENLFNGDTRINLTRLNINNNALIAINRRTFLPCIHLEFLDLSVNKLEATDFQLPQKLVKLNMSHNSLYEMPLTFQQWFQNIKILDLSHNRIRVLSAPNLQFFPQNVTIDLQHNNISTIDLQFEEFPNVSINGSPFVQLGFNPINCDCHIEFLLTHMRRQLQNRDVYFKFNLENLRCVSPKSLYGREVTLVQESELFCTIEKECPKPCKCLTRTEGLITEMWCPPNSLWQMPKTGPTNTSILNLTGNHISSLDGIQNPLWSHLSTLVLTNNQLNTLNISILPHSLTALHLDGNKFQRLTSETLDSLFVRKNLFVWFGNNPWLCDCEDPLEPWLESTDNVKDSHLMECTNIANMTVARYECEISGTISTNLLIGLVVTAIFFTILISFCGIAYYKYLHEIRVWLYSHQWCMFLVSEQDIDADKQFDAFISFSQEDLEWVAKDLLPGLEQQEPHYRLCVHHRDWLVGVSIPDQIVRSVEDSCRTIVVLSDNFIQSVWARMEFKTAHQQALQDRMNRVIIIVLGAIPPKDEMDPEMRMYLGLNTYLLWEDPWFWKKLRYAMPHKPVSSKVNVKTNTNVLTTVPIKGKKPKKPKNSIDQKKSSAESSSTSL